MRETKTRAYTPAGLLAALGGVMTWGLGVLLIKSTASSFLIVSFYRHAFSVPILVVAWAMTKDRRLPWRTAGFGGVLFAVHQLANFSALRYSTAAVVTILFSLQPVLVGMTGQRLVGERATARFFAWSGVAIAGCALLVVASSGSPQTTPLGTVLAVINLLGWTAYYVATKRARADTGTIAWLLVMTIVSGAIVGTIALVAQESFVAPHAREWMFLLLIGLVPGTIGHLLMTWAQPRIHVAASSAVILGVPVIATMGAAVLLDEPLGPWHIAGALIALAGAGAAMRHLPPPVATEAAQHYGEVAS